MKIILLSADAIRLEPEPGLMTIEANSAEQSYSPFHMLASGLALCTYSVLHSWAETIALSTDDLALEVRWSFAEDPHRIGAIEMTLHWPRLPERRVATAYRVAELCAIHNTLTQAPTITMAYAGGTDGSVAHAGR